MLKENTSILYNKIKSNRMYQSLIVFLVILFLPRIFTNEFTIHIFQNFAIMYIVVIGLDIVVGFIGEISLGHVGFYAIGAYTSGLLVLKAGIPFWLAFLAAPVLAAVFGILLALLSLRAKGPYMAMLSIAFGFAIFFIANQWLSLTGGPAGLYGVPRPRFFGHSMNNTEYFYLIAIVAMLLQLIVDNLLRHRWGRTFKALFGSEIAAKTVGINVFLYKVIGFSISAFLAGIAGAFFAHQNGFLNSDAFVFDTSVIFLIAVIFGGAGTKLGPLVGTLVITLITQFSASMADYHVMILGGLLLLALLVLPDGIVGELNHFIKSIKNKDKKISEKKEIEEFELANHLAEFNFKTDDTGFLLIVKKVAKIFGAAKKGVEKGKGLRAVDTVDLEIEAGKIHGLIGPNGSGKTTLLNVLAGVYSPDEGDVSWKGENVNNFPPHVMAENKVTRTFQNIKLFGNLTTIENVMAGFHLHYKSNFLQCLFNTKSAIHEEELYRDKAFKLLEFMGIAHFSEEIASNLSYGDQRRLEIARALAVQPELLLLDEPAAGLNPNETKELSNLVLKIRNAGITVLIIEHHLEMIMGICDKVSVLDSGKKIAEGLPLEVRQNPKVIEAYLGSQGRSES